MGGVCPVPGALAGLRAAGDVHPATQKRSRCDRSAQLRLGRPFPRPLARAAGAAGVVG